MGTIHCGREISHLGYEVGLLECDPGPFAKPQCLDGFDVVSQPVYTLALGNRIDLHMLDPARPSELSCN